MLKYSLPILEYYQKLCSFSYFFKTINISWALSAIFHNHSGRVSVRVNLLVCTYLDEICLTLCLSSTHTTLPWCCMKMLLYTEQIVWNYYKCNHQTTLNCLSTNPTNKQTNQKQKAYLFNEQKKRDHEIALSDLISNGLSDMKVQDEVANGNLAPGLLQLSNNVRITVCVFCLCLIYICMLFAYLSIKIKIF